MTLFNILMVAFLCLGAIQAASIRRRDSVVDATDCEKFGFPIRAEESFNPCGFPLIVAGFGVSGLPETATEMLPKNVGGDPDYAFYRSSENPPTCNSIVSSVIFQGSGINNEAPTEGEFTWTGKFALFRPAGQTSFADEFPDQEGSIWAITGRVYFTGTDFTLLDYKGKPPVDICDQLLAE